ncbi:alpha/beta-hydrolase [Trichodelitschia bisporula]|uniref:Carboxylic ester hydrolase n=1 Tax=Trichodelitschia bisporula TaxID=703511 RepID=A0A6G1HUY8_9PEZI|nr:alpha/beta-hydrolase [Trichodelitschia bisporula]
MKAAVLLGFAALVCARPTGEVDEHGHGGHGGPGHGGPGGPPGGGPPGGGPGGPPKLPVVDLGYTLQRATFYNESGRFYNFSNIRYAAPPVGDLRFALPAPPAKDRSVQTGEVGRICPQATPAWELQAAQFIPEYLLGLPINVSTALPSGGVGAPDPRTTEDCLFLDVVVPRRVFEHQKGNGAPVIVWIYGGGFVAGDKSGTNGGNPAGLIHRGNDSVVFVAINYRLGLHDQRFALQWVQDHIADFGGDPDQVTVIGESAGGASILHQITAYGGTDNPFHRAIMQSPGFLPTPSPLLQEKYTQTYLSLLNVSTIEQARQLPSAALITANTIYVALQPYGSFGPGPSVDGDLVPDLPGRLIKAGNFDKSIKVLASHNANEGLLFTPWFVTSDPTYRASVKAALPLLSNATLDYIATTLYPPVFDGSYGYVDETQRSAQTVADLVFVCNTRYINSAAPHAWGYRFDILPGLHGQDVAYTFYNDQGVQPPNLVNLDAGLESVDAALALQEWITSFARGGEPSAGWAGVGEAWVGSIPQYDGGNIESLSVNGTQDVRDDARNRRCDWWQTADFGP